MTARTVNGNGTLISTDHIPSELKALSQWVRWKEIRRGKVKAKEPYRIDKKAKAKVNDPATWGSFPEAMANVNGFGIGFVFADTDDFCGIDLDGCRNPDTGEIAPWAALWVKRFNSYTEVSPSGTGVKIWIRGKNPMPSGKKTSLDGIVPAITDTKSPGVEVYDRVRYFAMTGAHLADVPATIEARQDVLDKFCETYWPPESTHKSNGKQKPGGGSLTVGHSGTSASDRCKLHVETMPNAISGKGGHDATFNVACECFRYALSDTDAWEIMTWYNAEKCQPPWTDKELKHKLDDARETVNKAGQFGNRNRAEYERTSTPPKSSSSPQKRTVALTNDLQRDSYAAWEALHAWNTPARLFRYGSVPARVERTDDNTPVIKLIDKHAMRYALARASAWAEVRHHKKEDIEIPCAPPMSIVLDVLATPDMPLPILKRVVRAPIFAANGSLQTQPGYQNETRVFYDRQPGLKVPKVSDVPSLAELRKAVSLIVDELLVDFPFTGDSERATAMALFLHPFCRELISGPTPLHLFEKPSPGTGGTLLVEILCYPAMGQSIATMSEGHNEDEWRKRITARLASGPSHVFIDNLRSRLDSAAVSTAITGTVWSDRILGGSTMAHLPVGCAWIASGNNPAISSEISRRTVRCRLDAGVDRPWMRRETEFKHADIKQWAEEHRGELIWAALTMIRAWLAAGSPMGQTKLGMFEGWSSVIGGILHNADVPGFLENLAEFYDASDDEGDQWRSLLSAWWTAYGDHPMGVSDLFRLAEQIDMSMSGNTERAQKIRFGKNIVRQRDRTFTIDVQDDKKISVRIVDSGKYQGAQKWKLRQIS